MEYGLDEKMEVPKPPARQMHLYMRIRQKDRIGEKLVRRFTTSLS